METYNFIIKSGMCKRFIALSTERSLQGRLQSNTNQDVLKKNNKLRFQLLCSYFFSFHYLRGFNMLSVSFRYLATASFSSSFIDNSDTVKNPAKQVSKYSDTCNGDFTVDILFPWL